MLVVDDDAGRLQTLRHVLSGGYDVVTAQGGALGLERFRAEDFHLVLADLRMPDLSGLELLAEIREHKPNQTVIIFTAYGSSATKSAAEHLGAVAYVDGLWNTDEILELVRTNIKNPREIRERRARESMEIGPATERWLGFVSATARSARDLSTLLDAAKSIGTSLGTLKRTCEACGVSAGDSLDFGRALRVVMFHAGRKCRWYDVLAIREPTTMGAFLARAGFPKDDVVPTLETYLKNQRFIADPELLLAVLVTLKKKA